MRNTLKIAILTLVTLIVLDGAVAAALHWADRSNRLTSVVNFFEYGRSVPGKLARWEQRPDLASNIYDLGWRSDTLALSAAQFADEADDTRPVLRFYGMSFTNNIIDQAHELRPDLTFDAHSGPAAPPNFTYALFEDDRANRREGDVVVLGVLSSVVSTMAAFSNRTRLFEQPAPLTYPIYRPADDGGLIRIDPIITTPEQQRQLAQDPKTRAAWYAQMEQEDAYYSSITFGQTWLDASPFARLVRRALGQSHINQQTADILNGDVYPYDVVLPRMIRDFAATARADGQTPVVVLVQTNRALDVDLLAVTQDMLDAENIPYLATAELFDPKDLSGYLPDGHFLPEVDRLFAQRLIAMLDL